jgi:hypothetical protein
VVGMYRRAEVTAVGDRYTEPSRWRCKGENRGKFAYWDDLSLYLHTHATAHRDIWFQDARTLPGVR